jgi:hypothetical protein
MEFPKQGEKIPLGSNKEAIANTFTPEELVVIYLAVREFKEESELNMELMKPNVLSRKLMRNLKDILQKLKKSFESMGIDIESFTDED